MKPVILLSGLPEEDCRQLLGDTAWAIIEQAWRDPDALAADRPAGLDGAELLWLYRSPALELLLSPPTMRGDEVLERWTRRNRSAMNLRRTGLARLVPVNIGLATRDDLAKAWPVLADALPQAPETPVVEPGLVDTIDWLLRWSATDSSDVYAVLEAAAITGRRLEGGAEAGGAEESLLRLVEAVRRGAAPEHSAPVTAVIDLQEAERHRYRAENLARQLQQVRDELDQCYLHARHVERVLVDRDADWSLAREFRERVNHEEQLLLQLQGAQEELELHQRHALKQEQALESERERCARAEDEVRALQARLDQALSEMRAQALQPGRSVAGRDPVRRAYHGFRRRVMGRIRPDWAFDAPDVDRERALHDLRYSRWFDRDWYAKEYADVQSTGIDPVEHYHDHGWCEGRDPGPHFSTTFYLEAYPDVVESGMVPLLHFIRHGLQEGRLPRAD